MVTKVSPSGIDIDELTVLNLGDTPSSYGTTGQVLAVNAGADGLTFQTVSGGGTTAFVDLTDGPGSLGTSGQYVAMNSGATALEFITPPTIPTVKEDFTDLDDTPASYTGQAGNFLKVNSGATGLEFAVGSELNLSLLNLSDTPDNYSTADGKFLQYDADSGTTAFSDINGSITPSLISFHDLNKTPAESASNNGKFLRQKSDNSYDLEWVSVSSGASALIGLSDTPASYGTAGQYLKVNDEETGFVYETLHPHPPIIIDVFPEETTVTSGTNKYSFRMPYAAILTDIRASVNNGPNGGPLVVDVNAGGASVIGANKLTIDNNETSSTTSDVTIELATTSLTDDQLISVDVDTVNGTPTGLRVTLLLD
jgi:hypothetical protein